jgi:hypothetical protein
MNPASSLVHRSRRGLALLGVAVTLTAGGAAALWGRRDASPPAARGQGASPPTPPPAAPDPAPSDGALAWPVAPYTAAQVAEARGCHVVALAAARYPAALPVALLPIAFAPRTACEHATLASACAARIKGDASPPPACVDAYVAAVRANPAFAFIGNLPGGYFGATPLVAPPPGAGRPVVAVTVAYTWGGYGEPVAWIASVRDATTTPTIAITGATARPAADLVAKVATLGTSLDSLLPIPAPLRATSCTDNEPDWTVTLEFAGGGRLVLFTHGSNLLHLGGPWQATIDGATYLQLAPSFMTAVAHLAKALDLPLGEPAGMTCGGYDLAAAAFGE